MKHILTLIAGLLATVLPTARLAADDPLPVFVCVGGSNMSG